MYTRIISSVDIRKAINKTLIATFLLLCACYAFFIMSTVINVVERSRLEKLVIEKNVDVSKLEASYMETRNKLTMDYALSLGFVEAKNTKFISLVKDSQNLSLNNR